ncbi:signal peptide peptidase SppA [Geobacter sp.]|uniref:signal peptide peptidase SppA n=1 Tax=Geobacter sp. TaxID=46610 RepID=UPI002613E9C8|nr:signal peptide peptidase SppA [Geobacter sp.]
MRCALRLAAVLSLFLLTACAYVNANLTPPLRPLEETVLEGEGRPKILLLDVTGIISEVGREGGGLSAARPSTVARVKETLRKAEKDDDVVGVVLRINSPGGTVTASDVIYHELMRFRERKKVPVHACITGIGASGGYYIATVADRIAAHPTAVTGSIGVMLRSFNLEGLMGKVGVTEKAIKSGDKKDILSPFREMTPEERQILQGIIDRLQGRFLETVLARPGNRLGRAELEKLADGRVFTADEALQAGLIDRVEYLDDVIAGMKKGLGIEAARVVSYYRPGHWRGTIYSGEAAASAAGLASLGGDLLETLSATEFLYLWKW